ncbi:hypothetical protein B0J18DRAFT_195875 [Chaetomium sp. MPI-SDFR-AT-0129]|nr:hypothetical protein B0J18DRAFT_195875 [Chaetomium sp. MPI-SDFR-AT-0129]
MDGGAFIDLGGDDFFILFYFYFFHPTFFFSFFITQTLSLRASFILLFLQYLPFLLRCCRSRRRTLIPPFPFQPTPKKNTLIESCPVFFNFLSPLTCKQHFPPSFFSTPFPLNPSFVMFPVSTSPFLALLSPSVFNNSTASPSLFTSLPSFRWAGRRQVLPSTLHTL